eukprot:GDKI01033611.1.p1 GENE.GDKI01033611.1~~GDKI01033611.1.p1  ORF type:complete len:186 (+),score=23.33 GDKI01033611.1:290-847(+)
MLANSSGYPRLPVILEAFSHMDMSHLTGEDRALYWNHMEKLRDQEEYVESLEEKALSLEEKALSMEEKAGLLEEKNARLEAELAESDHELVRQHRDANFNSCSPSAASLKNQSSLRLPTVRIHVTNFDAPGLEKQRHSGHLLSVSTSAAVAAPVWLGFTSVGRTGVTVWRLVVHAHETVARLTTQ